MHGLLQEERLSGATLLVFANKTDVNGCMDEREIQEVSKNAEMGLEKKNPVNSGLTRIQALQLDVIKTHKWNIIRCSAVTGVNLKEGLA